MTKKFLGWLLVTFFVANVSIAQAQQPGRIPRIGYVLTTSVPTIVGLTLRYFSRRCEISVISREKTS